MKRRILLVVLCEYISDARTYDCEIQQYEVSTAALLRIQVFGMWGCVFDIDIPGVSKERHTWTLNYWPLKIQAVGFLHMSISDYSTAQHYTPNAGNACLCPSRWRQFVIRVWRMSLLDVGKVWEACNARSGHRTVPPLMRCWLKRLVWELVCPLVRLFRKKIAKSAILACHVFPSVRPRGTTRFPLDRLSLT